LGQNTRFDSVIVRLGGEIGIKSEWTRREYEKLLLKNIRNTLNHFGVAYHKIIHKRGRIYVETSNAKQVANTLTRVFGISSVSPAKHTSSDMKTIVQTTLSLARATLKKRSSFAVRCHRVGQHTYSSMGVCKTVGEQILTRFKDKDLRVDLTNPEATINVEVRDDEAYVFSEALQGGGGFPVGSQGKVICLLSGGIDSPVACWLAMKRGCTIVPVYFDNSPLTDDVSKAKALDIARKLFEWSIGYPRRVYIVPHGKNLQTFVKDAPRKLTCLLCKRMMYRIAERIAQEEKAEGIVTGEAIGEQASQTITNLKVLNEATRSYPVHRPLLGFDKNETEAVGRKIGTFEISTRKAKGCTAAPDKPATKAKLEDVKKAEANLNIEKMVQESINEAQTMTV